jgi:RIO-like serine/threonine protein kinase
MSLIIGEIIGKGGQSDVFSAQSEAGEYAIKLFHEESVYEKELEILQLIK